VTANAWPAQPGGFPDHPVVFEVGENLAGVGVVVTEQHAGVANDDKRVRGSEPQYERFGGHVRA
jgi:hypothetical protein